MASSNNVEEIWKQIVSETISCVLDDSPNDAILASYLGKGVENKYQVHGHINLVECMMN